MVWQGHRGDLQTKKTLSKIPHYAPKPNVAARTLYHGHIGFLGGEKGGVPRFDSNQTGHTI